MDTKGNCVVPDIATPNDIRAGPSYCIDYDEEAVEHDPELDVEREDEEKEWRIERPE